MSAWKPTDEQIQSATWAVYGFDDEAWKRLHWRRRVDYSESVAELFESPAFQSIIRAAQAEAVRHFTFDLVSVVNGPLTEEQAAWVESQAFAEMDRLEDAS